MKFRLYFILFLIALIVSLSVAAFEHSPGYMDAEYYYAGGIRLAQGNGFSEKILWNYLDDPVGLPHASHAYWMPFASILAWLGMKVGGVNFNAARLFFILIAACLPPLVANLTYSITGRKNDSLLAGSLGIFPAFYLPFFVTTDTFAVYMVLGILYFRVVTLLYSRSSVIDFNKRPKLLRSAFFFFLILGVIAGLMHLTRQDGILWLGFAFITALFEAWNSRKLLTREGNEISPNLPGKRTLKEWTSVILPFMQRSAFIIVGYFVVMNFWLFRNYKTFSSILAPGGSKTLWLTSYDELYIYPVTLLTPARFLQSGFQAILDARLQALGQNLASSLAVQAEIFLAPLILIGLWRLRRNHVIQLGLIAWFLTLVMMTFVFPFAGERGGFFHSGAAIQPIFWVTVPEGLEGFLQWGKTRRGWRLAQARPIFQSSIIFLALLVSIFLVQSRVIGPTFSLPVWGNDQARYVEVEKNLEKWGAGFHDVIMVNNPPGYYLASGRPSISIPFGDRETILEVAKRYQARYLVLEIDQVEGETNWFEEPGDRPGIRYLGTAGGARIFKLEGGS